MERKRNTILRLHSSIQKDVKQDLLQERERSILKVVLVKSS